MPMKKLPVIKPAYTQKSALIVTSSRDVFSPYVGVLIESILENARTENNYDIVVLEDKISKENKATILSLVQAKTNISVRFFNIGSTLDGYNFHSVAKYVPKLTCARLMIPELFPEHEKAIWIDADTVVNHDIADLYNINVSDVLLAAVHDVGVIDGYGDQEIFDKVLKVSRKEYFNAGVLVLNCTKFRKTYTTQYVLETAARPDFAMLDQDALNYLCKKQIEYLPLTWNYHSIYEYNHATPENIRHEYSSASKNPYIIHYIGDRKPGEYPTMKMAHYFWKYARNTPYYEVFWHDFIKAQTTLPPHAASMKPEMTSTIRLIMPIINRIFPQGSKRRSKVKKYYFQIRGWE